MSEVSQDDKTMGMIAHLSGIVTGFIGPLVIWLINKDKSDKAWVIEEAKEALNFQITVLCHVYLRGVDSDFDRLVFDTDRCHCRIGVGNYGWPKGQQW